MFYFYVLLLIIMAFIAIGIIFFIKNASNMSRRYFLLTLLLGMLSVICFSAGFIIPDLGFSAIFFAQAGVLLYTFFLLMSILYPTNQ